jgi:hypothetical protein
MPLPFSSVLVVDHDFARTRDDDRLALAVGHVAHRGVEAHQAGGLGIHAGGHGGARGGATDVEGTHRQLRARFADRLRGNSSSSHDWSAARAGQATPSATSLTAT